MTKEENIKISFGMNPQGGDMHPFSEEVAQTLALGHMGGVAIVFFKYRQSSKSQKPWSTDGSAQSLSSGCSDAAVVIVESEK